MEPRDLKKGDRLRIVEDLYHAGKDVLRRGEVFEFLHFWGRYKSWQEQSVSFPLCVVLPSGRGDKSGWTCLGWHQVEMADALTPALEAAFRAKYGPQIGDTVKVKGKPTYPNEGKIGMLELDKSLDCYVLFDEGDDNCWIPASDLEITAYGPGLSSRKAEE